MMLAYHNNPELKAFLLCELQRHREADRLVKGVYWQHGKGCAVGCTLDAVRRFNGGGADLTSACLVGANLHHADLTCADITGSICHHTVFTLALFTGIEFGLPREPLTIPQLDAKILAALEAGGRLDMHNWHTCETTHCRAGWAITLAGEAGRELEKRYGVAAAGAIIYGLSRPYLPVPDFYADNDAAMADIRASAAAAASWQIDGSC
jgi:hypothetical protein